MRLLAAVALSACGYQPLVTAAPFAAQRLVVLPFLEDDAVGLAPDLAQELSTLLARGGATLTVDRDAADAVVTGMITRVRAEATPGLTSLVSAYELTVEVSMRLVQKDATLFATTLSATDDYRASAADEPQSPLYTEANRREAVRRLAARLARQLYDRLSMAGLPRQDEDA